MIEITTFRLAGEADVAAFDEADRRVQSDFAYQQAGLLRRTVARHHDGHFVVIALWRSAEDADAAVARQAEDPAIAAFTALVDADSVRTERYTERD